MTLIVIVLGVGSSIDAAVGRAAVVLHLEGEARVGRADGVGRRCELQQAARDVGDRDELAGGHGHAIVGQACRLAGSVVISTANKLLAGLSLGSVKPKSAGGERVGRVLRCRDGIAGADRRRR